MGRHPHAMPGLMRHYCLMISERDHRELMACAERLNKPMSEIVRQAIKAYLMTTLAYYYVKTPDGAFIPPANEPGFNEFEAARLVAVQQGGEIVQRYWEPICESVLT